MRGILSRVWERVREKSCRSAAGRRRPAARVFAASAALAAALILPCGQALAAASARPVRTFVYENTLYTYVELEGVESPVTQVEAKIGSQSFSASGRLETVRQAGFPITYLLLVDNSTSMPPYRKQLADFCSQLAKDSGEKTRFILATLGDSFQVLNENVPAESMEEQLAAISFDEDVTRLHSCINSALDYFETLPRQGNELRSMIVITDAVQYDPQGGVPYEQLLERTTQSDVMLHSLGMGSDAAALDSLGKLIQASGGMHQVLGDSLTPGAAADALSESGGALMVTGFDLTGNAVFGENQEVSFTFASGGSLLCRGEAVADIPEPAGAGAASSDGESASAEGETSPSAGDETAAPAESGAESSAEEGTADASTEETTAPKEASPSTANPGSGPSDAQGMQGGQGSSVPEEKGKGVLWIAGGIAGAAAVAAAVLFLVRGKNKKPGQQQKAGQQKMADEPQPGKEPEGAAGIYMRIDVPEGVLDSGRKEFTLRRELTIGRDFTCDIVLRGEAVPAQAARIFLENGRICMEALSSQTAVLVNDQPVKGSCPLRSGDRISIAGCVIRPLF